MKLRGIYIERMLFLFVTLISCTSFVCMYLNLQEWIPAVEGDVFYDADSIRTLNYLQDPWSALSYIRPTLVILAAIGFLPAAFLSPYLAWLLISLSSFSVMLLSIFALSKNHRLLGNKWILVLVLSNFASAAFLLVPDTFILSAALFLLGIVVLEKRQTVLSVGASFVISSGTNIFFAVPWTLYFFLRKFGPGSLKNFALGAVIPLSCLLGAQWLAKKLVPTSSTGSENYARPVEELELGLQNPEIALSNILGSSDALSWLHNPLENLMPNLLSFFSGPWTVNYDYVKGALPTVESAIPFWVIFFGIALTIAGYKGLYDNRKQFRNIVLLLSIIEVSCLLLFITYGTHPYLFAPFLIASRVVGLSLLGFRRTWLRYGLIAMVPSLNLLTQYYVFL